MTPRATMRLQFHKGFTFADAAALVPYFSALGISHLYASPIMTARPGSLHGYDVIDPTASIPSLAAKRISAARRRAAPPRHGNHRRHRSQSYGDRRRQSVVDGRSRRAAAPAATPNISISTGSRSICTCAARCCCRCWGGNMAKRLPPARSSLKSKTAKPGSVISTISFPLADATSHAVAQALAGGLRSGDAARPRAPARDPGGSVLPAGLVAPRQRRDQLAALFRHQRSCRHARRRSTRCSKRCTKPCSGSMRRG